MLSQKQTLGINCLFVVNFELNFLSIDVIDVKKYEIIQLYFYRDNHIISTSKTFVNLPNQFWYAISFDLESLSSILGQIQGTTGSFGNFFFEGGGYPIPKSKCQNSYKM